MTLDPTDVAPPLHDGRYRLRAVLGEGGMAIVYRAWDRRLEVDRAVKILQPAMAARPRIRERFHAEARTMARLSHPHIVSVHDVDADGDRVYIVMELLTGGTLWDRVQQRGAMPPVVAVDAVLPALAALGHAHAAGVVHRDVKPQNVLLSDRGVAKLTDFGIARVEDADSRTRTAAVMGTWTYMPPEQRNSAKHVDARSDLYAVGAMLWALTHGQEPPDLFAADMDPALLADLPPALAEVVRVATRYRPDDRFEDAAQMASALDACRDALPALDADLLARWPAPSPPSVFSTSRASSARTTGAPRSDPAVTLPPSGDPAATVAPQVAGTGGGPASALSSALSSVVSAAPAAATTSAASMGLATALQADDSADPAPGTPPGTMVPLGEGTLADDAEPAPATGAAARRSRLPVVLGLAAVVVLALGVGLQLGRDGRDGAPAAPTSAAPTSAAPTSAAPTSAAPTSAAPTSAAPPVDGAATASEPAAAAPTGTDAQASPAEAAADVDGATALETAVDDVPVQEAAADEAADQDALVEEPAVPAGAAGEPALPDAAAEQTPTGTAPAATAPPPATARVTVTGKVTLVKLIDKTTGRAYDPGEVPVGDYDVQVRFDGDAEAQRVTQVRVAEGWDVVIRCHAGKRICQQ